MIVPMKKVSLIILENKKTETLKKLRKLGLLHIEIAEGFGEKLDKLKEQLSLLESAIFYIPKTKNTETRCISNEDAISVARDIISLAEAKKSYLAEVAALNSELERLKSWGDIFPEEISSLAEKGVDIAPYEMPYGEYESLGETVKTICLEKVSQLLNF